MMFKSVKYVITRITDLIDFHLSNRSLTGFTTNPLLAWDIISSEETSLSTNTFKYFLRIFKDPLTSALNLNPVEVL